MKQFQIELHKTLEGYDASVPSIRECETWAKTEDEALDGVIDRLKYFLSLPEKTKYTLDRARKEDDRIYYIIMIEA